MSNSDDRSFRFKLWAWSSGITTLMLIWFVVRRYFTPEFFIFDVYALLFGLGLFALVHLAILVSAFIKPGRRSGRGLRLPGLFFALGLATVWFIGRLEHKRESVPTVLSAYYDGDINGVGLDLRTDGTYRAVDASVLGGPTFYGTYRLAGDTIELLEEQFRLDDEVWRFGKRMVVDGDSIRFLSGPPGWSPEMRVTEDRRR
ncbi:MAG: hypothetical protein IT227_15160 [Flavobacteriales bacterium]|nr:hypothetical protein [Flavobacteriales bacterium]